MACDVMCHAVALPGVHQLLRRPSIECWLNKPWHDYTLMSVSYTSTPPFVIARHHIKVLGLRSRRLNKDATSYHHNFNAFL